MVLLDNVSAITNEVIFIIITSLVQPNPWFYPTGLTVNDIYSFILNTFKSHWREIPPCKAKRQYLITLQISRYCLSALQRRIFMWIQVYQHKCLRTYISGWQELSRFDKVLIDKKSMLDMRADKMSVAYSPRGFDDTALLIKKAVCAYFTSK